MKDINAYQEEVTAHVQLECAHRLEFITIGLAGETGEFAEKVKKHIRGDFALTEDVKADMAKELGDIMWHISRAASIIGYSLSDVLEMNINKRESRRARGVVMGSGDNR